MGTHVCATRAIETARYLCVCVLIQDGKTMSDYLSGWREGTDKLMTQPDKNIFVDMSQSTFAFYWAAGTKPHL